MGGNEVDMPDEFRRLVPLCPYLGGRNRHIDGASCGLQIENKQVDGNIITKQDFISQDQALHAGVTVGEFDPCIYFLDIVRFILCYPHAKRDIHAQCFGEFGDMHQCPSHRVSSYIPCNASKSQQVFSYLITRRKNLFVGALARSKRGVGHARDHCRPVGRIVEPGFEQVFQPRACLI